MAKTWPSPYEQFERTFDALFDEMLGRWRAIQRVGGLEDAVVLEYDDRYEVGIATGTLDPAMLEVETTESSLTVRARNDRGGIVQRGFTFAVAVDRHNVTARWNDRTLTIILPKLSSKTAE